jgi:hypothetical protein
MPLMNPAASVWAPLPKGWCLRLRFIRRQLTYAGGGRNMIRSVALCKIENGQKVLIQWMNPALKDIPQPE